jgi:3-methyladenine DNA glycosylase AlkD
MDAWARGFDNWDVCDTVCWHLFDYTPFAFEKARRWSRSPSEFVKRAGFALMAGQAGHNKNATDAQFLALLPLIEKGARDERNFVKTGVSWALRRIGGRSAVLHEASSLPRSTRRRAGSAGTRCATCRARSYGRGPLGARRAERG